MIIHLMSNPNLQVNMRIRVQTRCIAWGLLAIPFHVMATGGTTTCQPDLIAPLQFEPALFTKHSMALPLKVNHAVNNLTANQLTQPTANTYLFQGNARFHQPGLVVLSDKMRFDKTKKEALFTGHVELHQPEIILTANQVFLDEAKQSATLSDALFQVMPSRVHGAAQHIQLEQRHATAQLHSASLTACRKQPDHSPTWELNFKKLNINQTTELVTGFNTTLHIKGVPIFYTPYFSYSLADRASGFLFAEFGRIKSLTQSEQMQYLKIPYFFNIAPNIDDTLTLIPMEKRGMLINNEFRYLTQYNNTQHRVTFNVSSLQDQLTAKEGLVSADTAGNLSYGKKLKHRWRASLDVKQSWGNGLSSRILWHEASDENVYADLPIQSRFKTVTQIPRHLKLDYRQGDFQAYAQVLSYLRLRNARLNYEKRPELGLRYRQQVKQVNLNVKSSITDFVLPVASQTRPEALRFTLQPSADYQINQSYGSLKTTLTGNYTQYQMVDNAGNTTGDLSHALFVPQFSLRGKLIFERAVTLFGQSFTQTLEPEIQYLYVPYQNQDKLPLFDTGNRSLAFSNLFTQNRFTGSDRIGDTNQVTTALTTRFLNPNGRQILDAGIGQIIYLEDRLVGLTQSSPQSTQTSDVFIKMGLNIGALNLSSTLQLTRQDYKLLHANSRLKYRSKQYGTLLANHVLTNNDTPTQKETLSMGGYARVTQNWQLGLYINYDMYNKQMYNSNIGVRYDACCWSAELMTERTQLDNDLYNDEFRVQFELKGLSTSKQAFKDYLSKKLKF